MLLYKDLLVRTEGAVFDIHLAIKYRDCARRCPRGLEKGNNAVLVSM